MLCRLQGKGYGLEHIAVLEMKHTDGDSKVRVFPILLKV
jgi:hypothetical protein